MKFAGQDSDSEEEDDEGEFDSDEEFPDYLIDEMDPEAMAQYRTAQQNNKRYEPGYFVIIPCVFRQIWGDLVLNATKIDTSCWFLFRADLSCLFLPYFLPVMQFSQQREKAQRSR